MTLTVGQWYHLGFLWDPSGGAPHREIAINGQIVLNETTGGFGGVVFGTPGIKIAGDGFVGAAAHVALYYQLISLTNVAALYPYATINPTAEITLSDVNAPGVDNLHRIRYRIASKELPSQLELTVTLLQGATEIASWIQTRIGPPKTFEYELTELQASAITDYTNLRLRFTVKDKGFTNRDIRIVGV